MEDGRVGAFGHTARMRTDRFERLYAEHAERLFAFLAYRTGDRVLAEDLLADVFERALRKRRTFDPRKGSETTWLYAIALNRLRDEHRRAEVERRALETVGTTPASDPDGPEDRLADRDELSRALSLLSDAEREVLSLRFGADLTVPQIAKVTGEPLTTIEGRLYRGLRRMRGLLTEAPAPADERAPATAL
jgi:RNA polymerase sigma-70 factor (ECF subfamily)